MYKAILVDDDVAVLEFLKKLIPWQRLGFELAGEYTDALDAIRTWEGRYPELIVTDIGMPGLDGLSFIRRVQSEEAGSRFVILSCHDEFHYAQQAVQLGVQDYLLKETLTPGGISDIAARVKAGLDEDRRLKTEVDRLQSQANRSQSADKEKWLRDLLASPYADDSTVLSRLGEYGLSAEPGHFLPVLFRAHRYRDALGRYRQEEAVKFIVENAAEELLGEERDVLFLGFSGQSFFLLHAFRKDLARNPYDEAAAVADRLRQAFARVLKLEYSVVIGEEACGGASIKRRLAELAEAGERLFYSDGAVVAKTAERLGEFNREDPFVYHFEYAERFNRLLLEATGDTGPAADAFAAFLAEKRFQPSNVKQLVWKLTLDMLLKLKLGMAYDKEKVQQDIGQITHIGELRDWLADFLREAVGEAERIAKKSKKTEIVDAQNYVRLHLGRKITLEEAAEHLHLNPSYFSRLFKKETGENFIEFVNRSKMEKAKELLGGGSGKTVEETAIALGYDNKSYFVKLFKQHFGSSPGRFL